MVDWNLINWPTSSWYFLWYFSGCWDSGLSALGSRQFPTPNQSSRSWSPSFDAEKDRICSSTSGLFAKGQSWWEPWRLVRPQIWHNQSNGKFYPRNRATLDLIMSRHQITKIWFSKSIFYAKKQFSHFIFFWRGKYILTLRTWKFPLKITKKSTLKK